MKTNTNTPTTPMTEDEIVQELNNLINNSNNSGDTENDTDITLPLDYYYGKLPGLTKSQEKDKSSSRYVSLDVQDGIEATVAEISNMFSNKEIAVFSPEDQYDEEQSIMETDLVNYIFFDEMNGYILLQQALRDALLHRNCCAKVYWDERTVVEYEEYENISPLALPELLTPKDDETIEVVEQDVEVVIDHENETETVQFIKIKKTKKIGTPTVELIKPENLIVLESQDSSTLENASFSAYKSVQTVSDLISQGFDEDLVKDLPPHQSTNTARYHTFDDSSYADTSTNNRPVLVYDCFLELDVDGDGIAEFRHIVISNNTLLLNEVKSSNSIVTGTTTQAPHTFKGISLFDKLNPIQSAKTHIFRAIIDGTRLSSNPRMGIVDNGANIDDILTSRTGGIVRLNNPNSLVSIPTNEVPQSSYNFLNFMDKVRSERGGSAINTAAQAQGVSGDTAHGIERVMSAIEMSNALLAKTFAETFIRGIFKELHNVIRQNITNPISAKVRGGWISSIPSDWKKRSRLTITMGGSTNERYRKIAALEQVITKQATLAQSGSTLFSEKKLYNALTQQAKLQGLPSPDSYYVDPSSEEGIKAQQSKAQQAQIEQQKVNETTTAMNKAQEMIGQAEMIKSQAQVQSHQAKFQVDQMKAQISVLKEQLDKQEAQDKLIYEYDKLYLDNSIKIAEIEAKNKVHNLPEEVQDIKEDLQEPFPEEQDVDQYQEPTYIEDISEDTPPSEPYEPPVSENDYQGDTLTPLPLDTEEESAKEGVPFHYIDPSEIPPENKE